MPGRRTPNAVPPSGRCHAGTFPRCIYQFGIEISWVSYCLKLSEESPRAAEDQTSAHCRTSSPCMPKRDQAVMFEGRGRRRPRRVNARSTSRASRPVEAKAGEAARGKNEEADQRTRGSGESLTRLFPHCSCSGCCRCSPPTRRCSTAVGNWGVHVVEHGARGPAESPLPPTRAGRNAPVRM